jgi:hypothetical protein
MELGEKLRTIQSRLEDPNPITGLEFKMMVLWLVETDLEKDKLGRILKHIPDTKPINTQHRRLLKKALDTFLWKRELLS